MVIQTPVKIGVDPWLITSDTSGIHNSAIWSFFSIQSFLFFHLTCSKFLFPIFKKEKWVWNSYQWTIPYHETIFPLVCLLLLLSLSFLFSSALIFSLSRLLPADPSIHSVRRHDTFFLFHFFLDSLVPPDFLLTYSIPFDFPLHALLIYSLLVKLAASSLDF